MDVGMAWYENTRRANANGIHDDSGFIESTSARVPRFRYEWRKNSGTRWGHEKPPRNEWSLEGKLVESAHRRPEYPLVGCVPAELTSVSPSYGKGTKSLARNKGEPQIGRGKLVQEGYP
jgi:hypothetical protein